MLFQVKVEGGGSAFWRATDQEVWNNTLHNLIEVLRKIILFQQAFNLGEILHFILPFARAHFFATQLLQVTHQPLKTLYVLHHAVPVAKIFVVNHQPVHAFRELQQIFVHSFEIAHLLYE